MNYCNAEVLLKNNALNHLLVSASLGVSLSLRLLRIKLPLLDSAIEMTQL